MADSGELIVVGVSHKTATVAARERFAVPASRLPEALDRLRAATDCTEGVILSTCNRVEVYVATRRGGEASAPAVPIKRFLADFHAQAVSGLDRLCYTHARQEGVRHLFRVAAGLESMVLGEGEVLRQVREAYETARAAGATSGYFNRLFQRAVHIGKRVRTETGIARGAVSVGSVAVELARRIFTDLRQKRVLLLGAGKMGEVTARHLADRGAPSLVVTNRAWERGAALAGRIGGAAVPFERRWEAMAEADIVITSTASPVWVITRPAVQRLMRQRRGRPLFLIDIAVPRNIEPSVHTLENVYLYDIDDLQAVVATNLATRHGELERARRLVDDEAAAFAAQPSVSSPLTR